MEIWRHKIEGVLVEAVRLNEANVEEVAAWCGGDLVEEIDPEHTDEKRFGINLNTPAGVKRATLHMYVVKYGRNFFTDHNRVFESRYEPVDRPAPPLESAGDSRKARGFGDPFDRGRLGP